jgi:antitoxin MazE
MKTAIRQWGNSLALRIPRAFTVETALVEGTTVDLAVRRGTLVITPQRRKKYRVADLVGGIKPANLHREQLTDAPAGKEIW